MTPASVIDALHLPADAQVDQRVPKKLLVENGAPTASDKRQINDGIEELLWIASLKPSTVGVPDYRDDSREYLEIAVLSVSLRAEAKAPRLTELLHRAIPYPVFLIQTQLSGLRLSLAHLRWSQGEKGQTVLDGSLVSTVLDVDAVTTTDFLSSLTILNQPRQHLHALYQGWIERFEAHAAARITGKFTFINDAPNSERRRTALAEHECLTREMAAIRSRAAKEKQVNRRVELNLQLKRLESNLLETKNRL